MRVSLVDLSEQSERMQSYYNLQHDPFGAIVDAMVFSGAGNRYETAETIRHLMAYSHQDSLLIGTVGSGKRMLAQQVLKMLEDPWRIAWIDGSETDSVTSLLKELVGQFGLGLRLDGNPEELLKRIGEITSTRTDNDESFLIVVQFADQLSVEIIEQLKLLRTYSADLSFRVRQLWLSDNIKGFAKPINEEDWYVHSLESFSDQDAEQYLKDRLIAAGNVSDFPITAKDINRLNQMSHGNPSQLNDLARDYLISATFRTAEKTQSFPLTHVIAGIAALSLVVIAFLYNVSERKEVTTDAPIAISEEPLSDVEKKLAVAVAKVEAKQQQAALPEDDVTSDSEPDVEQIDIAQKEDDSAPSNDVVNTDVVVLDEVVLTDDSLSDDAGEVIIAPEISLDRLLTRGNADEYTMQLIGVREKPKLDALVSSFGDTSNVDIVQTEYKGKPWFVLIYGRYPSKASALKDVDQLPAVFKSQEPWVRTFESIRSEEVI